MWSKIYRPMKKRRRPSSKHAAIGTPTNTPKSERRGVALIMVMVITTVMTAVATDLENESQVNLAAAVNARDEFQAHLHARSAVELELFVLRFQSQIKGTLGQFIPIPLFELSTFLVSSDTMKGLLDRNPTPKDDAVKDSYALSQPFGDFHGSFWVDEVVDENRKININTDDFGIGCENFMHLLMAAVFDDPKYDVLFESLGDSRDPIRNRLLIMSNISDWTDGDDFVDPICIITGDTTTQGASEDTRFNHLPYNVQYKPKNGMFNSLAELRMIPGVNDAFMRLFSKYFTVWSGDGVGISMTTADPWMIRAIIRAISVNPPQPSDEEKFQKFMQERSLMMALPPPLNKMSMAVFQQLLAQSQILYDPAKLKQLDAKKFIRFDDAANVFRIKAVGRVNDASSTITLVWRDNRAAGEIVYWREE